MPRRRLVFDDEARVTAELFALQAAMLLHASEQAAHLGRAVDSRDVIGQAKGILVERFGTDEDEAFRMLVESSQGTDLELVEVACWLAGEADGPRRTVLAMPGFSWPPRDTDRNRILCRVQVVAYALVAVYFGLMALQFGALVPWAISTVALAATLVVAVALVLMRAQRRAAEAGSADDPGAPTTRIAEPGR